MRPDQSTSQRPKMGTLQMGAIGIGAIGAVLGAVSLFSDTSHFFQIYLAGFVLTAEIALGCLGLVMLNNMINAKWLYPAQRFLEAGARTIPIIGLAFIPILFGLSDIYPWAAEGYSSYGGKVDFLTPTLFALRNVLYFVIWTSFAYGLTWRSYQRDEQPDDAGYADRARAWSAGGMVLFMVTTSLAAVDWTMSLNPEWFSSAYGWVSLSRSALTTMAILIVVMAVAWGREPLGSLFTKKVVGDYGALLLVTVLVWSYLNGISFVVIWSGNVTYFAEWFTARFDGSWGDFTTVFVLMQGVVLFLLLVPGLKGRKPILLALATVVLLLRVMEVYWIVMPNFSDEFTFQLWDLGMIVAFAGLWLGLTLWFYGQQAALPAFHPSTEDVIVHPAAQTAASS